MFSTNYVINVIKPYHATVSFPGVTVTAIADKLIITFIQTLKARNEKCGKDELFKLLKIHLIQA